MESAKIQFLLWELVAAQQELIRAQTSLADFLVREIPKLFKQLSEKKDEILIDPNENWGKSEWKNYAAEIMQGYDAKMAIPLLQLKQAQKRVEDLKAQLAFIMPE